MDKNVRYQDVLLLSCCWITVSHAGEEKCDSKKIRDMNVNLQIFELHSQNNIGGLCKRVTELDLYF